MTVISLEDVTILNNKTMSIIATFYISIKLNELKSELTH